MRDLDYRSRTLENTLVRFWDAVLSVIIYRHAVRLTGSQQLGKIAAGEVNISSKPSAASVWGTSSRKSGATWPSIPSSSLRRHTRRTRTLRLVPHSALARQAGDSLHRRAGPAPPAHGTRTGQWRYAGVVDRNQEVI